jgi:hypothetical protein
MTDGNLPQGAANDPQAPYNERLPKQQTVQVNISFDVYVVVNEGYTDADLEDAAELWRVKHNIEEKVSYVQELI